MNKLFKLIVVAMAGLLLAQLPSPPTNLGLGGSVQGEDAYCNVVGGSDGPAALPKVCYATLMAATPAPGPDVTVAAGASLQNAVNAAACGTRLHMQGGSTYTLGSLPQKNCDTGHYVYLMPDTASYAALPAEGHRASWCSSGVASLPDRPQQPDCGSVRNAMWKLSVMNPIAINGNTYRLIGVELFQPTGGTPYNMFQAAVGITRFVIDRYWAHGTANTNLNRMLWLKGASYIAAVNGSMTDFHGDGTVINQSGGINMDSGGGVVKVWNNFLESGGAPVGFGGGDNAYGVPSDNYIANNDFYKPFIWMASSPTYQPPSGGRPWQVTNHFETKNSIRTWFTHNTCTNAWGGFSQLGWCQVITPKSQASGGVGICPTCQVTDFVSSYNHGRKLGGAIQIANASSDAAAFAFQGNHYSFHDDLYEIGYAGCPTCAAYYIQITSSTGGPASFLLNNVLFNHMTFVPYTDSTPYMMIIGGPNPPAQANMGIINSILPAGAYGVQSPGNGDCSVVGSTLPSPNGGPLGRFNTCWTSPYQFTKNIVSGGMAPIHQQNNWPAGNLFPANQAAIGYTNMAAGNYRLLTTSVGYHAASDGKDIGADISKVAP